MEAYWRRCWRSHRCAPAYGPDSRRGAALVRPHRPKAAWAPRQRALHLSGAGGKTASLFSLARESPVPALVTSTTHFGAWQTKLADRHIIAQSVDDVRSMPDDGVTLITGPFGPDDRSQPVADDVLWRYAPKRFRADG